VFLSVDTTAAGSQINFNTNGANSLTSTGNPNGAIFIFDADGDITITGVAFDNPEIVNVNGGTVNNVTQRGFELEAEISVPECWVDST
jgi:hypothetical protein